MRYLKEITIALTCLAFIGCGGSDENSTSITTGQVTVESSAIAMELDKVYAMTKGSSITEDEAAIVEIKTDLLTGVTTTKLTSGSASISYN